MSEKYKVRDQDRPYFITFAVTDWVDVFTRQQYKDIVLDSLRLCQPPLFPSLPTDDCSGLLAQVLGKWDGIERDLCLSCLKSSDLRRYSIALKSWWIIRQSEDHSRQLSRPVIFFTMAIDCNHVYFLENKQ